MPDAAQEAWQESLRHDGESGWAKEAFQRLEEAESMILRRSLFGVSGGRFYGELLSTGRTST